MTFNVNAQVRLLPPTNAAQIAAQLRAQLSNVTANVNVNVSQRAQRNINNMNSSLKKTKAGAKEAASAMSDFGKQAALAGKRFFAFTIATSGILAFVSSLREGTKEAIAFQRELVKISQVTGTATRNLSDLTNEIARLSTTLGVDSNQLLKASRILAQTGLTAKQTERALQALAKSDLAPTFDDIISTTEGSIAIFRQFGVEADQLEGKLGSINAVAGKFAVESSDIIAAVRRTGGAFSAAGGNLEELIALFTSVRATTRESAESIATGFRTIFTRMQRVRTQNFLENLGIELRDAENQFVGPLQAIQRLSIALKDLRGTDPRFAQIIEELGGFRQVSKVIPLIQQFATAEKALGVAVAGTTSLTRDSETAQEALAVQIAKTREKFAEMIRTFTNSDTFQGTIKIMLKLADSLIKVTEALEPLLPMIGLLGSITVGRLGVSAFREFRQAGGFGLTGLTGRNQGGVFEFASGGLVPGVGNRDTVPAKLTPGEYVLRKSAVQRIGEENLQHLNGGGPAYGGVYLIGDIRAKKNKGKESAQRGIQGSKFQADLLEALNNRGISLEEYDLLYNKKPITQWSAWGSSDIAVEERVGALSLEYRGDFAKNVRRRMGEVMKKAAFDITKGEVKINNSGYVPEPEAVQGIVFEGAMARMGAPFDDDNIPDDKRPMDFPDGLPAGLAQSIQGHGGLIDIPVDAKRQENSKARKSIKDKYTRELADRLKAGKTFQHISIKKKEVQSAATGGSAYLPNAILTPGEFVVSKEDAARIGEDRLDYINRTGNIPGMSTGGSYSRMFKPKLTGRAISPGNVGRKKQYIDQLVDYLEKGMAQGLLDASEQRMLRQLKVRKTHIKDDRSRRFNKRFSLMNRGGAYGRIRRYATGGSTLGRTPGGTGPITGNLGNIALLIAGASALAGTIGSVNESLGEMITWITTLGSQFAILFTGLRTAQNFVGRFDKKIAGSFASGRATTSDIRTLRDRTNLIRASQQNGAVLTPAARQELREKEAQLTVARSARRQQVKNIRSQRRLQTVSTYAAGALAAFGAALTAWGSYLETKGREDIEKGLSGERLIAGRRLSSASSYGQGGALVGAAIGAFTPLTPAGGAIVGGLIGGGIGAVRGGATGRKEAFDLTQLRDFNEQLKITTFRLEGLAEGTTNVDAQAQEIANFVASTRNRLVSGVSTDTRRDILDSARQQVQGFNNVISQLAKTDRVANADSVEAGFQEILDSLGQDTVEFIARLTDVPYGQFNERIKRNIESIQSATKAQKELSAVQDRYTQQLRNIVNVSRVFNDVSTTMQKFDAIVGSSLDGLQAFDESARLADPAKFFDEAASNRLIARDITNNPFIQQTTPNTAGGTIGQQLGRDVTAAGQASRELPAILLRIRNNLSDFGGEDALTKLEAEFEGYPQFVRDAIIKAARGIIGDEGKQEKFVEAAQKDFTGTLKTLAAGLEPLNEVSAQLVKSMNEEANRRIASIQSIIQFADALTDARNNSLGVADEAERIQAQTRNRSTNLSLLQGNDDQRLQNILSPIGGGSATASRVINAQIKLQELKNKRDRDGIDVNADLTKQIKNQALIVQRTTRALEFLANVGERSAVTMEEFERAQKAVEFKTSLVDRGLGVETPEESRQFGLELRAARTAAQFGTLDVIPPQFRSEVLSLLESLGPGELDVLGGRSGDDVIKEFRRSFLNKIAATPGGPALTAKDIDRLVEGQSTETERLAGEIDKIIEESKRASAELERIASENLGNVADKFDESVTKFTNSIATLINARNIDKVKRDLAEASGSQEKLSTSLSAAKRFNATFGQSPAGLDEDRADAIGQNLALIKTVYDQRQQQQALKDFVEAERASRDQIKSSLEGFGGYIPFVDDVKVSDQAQLTDIGGGARSLLPYLNAKFGEQKRITSDQVETGIANQLARVTKLTGGNQQAIDAFRASIQQQRDENLKFEGGAGGTVSARKFAAAITIALEKASNAAASQYGSLSDAEVDLASKELNLTAKEIRLVGEEYDTIHKQWEAFAQSTSIDDLQAQLDKLTEKIKTYNQQLEDLGVTGPAGSQRGGIIGFNKGGVVPGMGSRDSVLAALTPGEVVIPKKYAEGGMVYASKNLERNLIEDEKKFQAARERRRKERNERYLRTGRVPFAERKRLRDAEMKESREARLGTGVLSEKEKAENRLAARALAQGRTTEKQRVFETQELIKKATQTSKDLFKSAVDSGKSLFDKFTGKVQEQTELQPQPAPGPVADRTRIQEDPAKKVMEKIAKEFPGGMAAGLLAQGGLQPPPPDAAANKRLELRRRYDQVFTDVIGNLPSYVYDRQKMRDHVYAEIQKRGLSLDRDASGFNPKLTLDGFIEYERQQRQLNKSPAQKFAEDTAYKLKRKLSSAFKYGEKVKAGIADISDAEIKKIKSDAEYPLGYFQHGAPRIDTARRLFDAGVLTRREWDNIVEDVRNSKPYEGVTKEEYRAQKTTIPVLRELIGVGNFVTRTVTPKSLEKYTTIPQPKVTRGSAVGQFSTVFDIGKEAANLVVNERTIPGWIAGVSLEEQIRSGYAGDAKLGAGDVSEMMLAGPAIGKGLQYLGKGVGFFGKPLVRRSGQAIYNRSTTVRRGVNAAKAPADQLGTQIPGLGVPRTVAERAGGLSGQLSRGERLVKNIVQLPQRLSQANVNIGEYITQRTLDPLGRAARNLNLGIFNAFRNAPGRAKQGLLDFGFGAGRTGRDLLGAGRSGLGRLGSGISDANLIGRYLLGRGRNALGTLRPSNLRKLIFGGTEGTGFATRKIPSVFERIQNRFSLSDDFFGDLSYPGFDPRMAGRTGNVVTQNRLPGPAPKPPGLPAPPQPKPLPPKPPKIPKSKVQKKPKFPKSNLTPDAAKMEMAIAEAVQDISKTRQYQNMFVGESGAQTAGKVNTALKKAFKDRNIAAELLPDKTRVLKTTRGMQKHAQNLEVTAKTGGFASPTTKDITLRKGVAFSGSAHEAGHIINFKLAQKAGVSYTKYNERLTKLFDRIRPKLRSQFVAEGVSPDRFDYLLSDSELFADLTSQILRGKTSPFLTEFRNIAGFKRGAFIPGIGSGDKVHAMLEPGEYVLNRNAVSAVGKTALDRVNNKYSRFQTGGQVGVQEGGGVVSMAMPDLTQLSEIMQIFGNKVDLFAESLNNINGMEIQLVANHKVEVIINGAQVLQGLMPSVQELIVAETNRAINSMLKSKFPDVGTVD